MTSSRRSTGAIVAVGVAAPSLRLAASAIADGWGRRGGRTRVAVCGPDEDTLTLGWLAAERAMRGGGVAAHDVDGLWWGCTRLPFAEGPSLAHLAAALRLRGDSDGAVCSGSPHAGIDALLGAADAVASGRVTTALVVASDALLPALGSGLESACGAGAVAVILAAEGPAALGSTVSRWRPVLDRYRGDQESETREVYDGRLFREQVFLPLCSEVANALGADASTRWSLPDPDGRLGTTLARGIGVETAVSRASRSELGDTGAAAALIGLADALATPGPAALLAYGGGRATALGIDVVTPVPGAERAADDLLVGREASYAEALRARGQLRPSGEVVEMAVPPGSAMFVRSNGEVLGLMGARCAACGTVNTPPNVHPVCITCGRGELDLVALPRRGTVHTFVVNRTMPAPFVAPLPLVVVDLEDGSRLMVQGAGDGADVAVGATVELTLRRYAVERGVPVYGYKATVVSDDDPTTADEATTQTLTTATAITEVTA